MNQLLENNPSVADKGGWLGIFTVEKFFTKDTKDLEHVVEYHDADLKFHQSPVLKGQLEVNDFLAWLERGATIPEWLLKYHRPKAKCITTPDETLSFKQLLVYGGISCLWECLIGNGTASAGQTLTYFNNAQAAIGVGDSATAAAATQTDLQAVTNKLRVGMNATYPQHTDGVVSGSATITWQTTFGNSQANYTWAEVGIFNSSTAATGRMLNRLVQALGVKSGGAWSISGQVSIS